MANCKRETLRKQLRCYNAIRLFTECGRQDPKIGDYIVYLVAATNLCDWDKKPYILTSLFILGANPNAKYRRQSILRIVLNSIGQDDMLNIRKLQVASVFVTHGVDPNVRDRRGNTLLHYAVRYCLLYDWLVEYLLDRGADPNVRNKQGETPLHVLLKYGHCGDEHKLDIARKLLAHGANPTIRDRDGKTPFEYARNEAAEILMASTLTP